MEEEAEDDESDGEEHEPGEVFADYRPSKLHIGQPHPDPVKETASLAAVEPPNVTYTLAIQELIDSGRLSGLQLESIVYACQRHEQLLPNGSRCGFFIGDGTFSSLPIAAPAFSPSALSPLAHFAALALASCLHCAFTVAPEACRET